MPIMGIVVLSLTCCGCMCAIGHGDYRVFVPPEQGTATFRALTAGSRTEPPQWEYTNMFFIIPGSSESSADPTNTPEDTYLEVAAGLADILGDHTLSALETPEPGMDYNAYAKELFGRPIEDWTLYVGITGGPVRGRPDDALFVSYIRVWMEDFNKCYLAVEQKTRSELETTCYAYYLDDERVIRQLWDWANGFLPDGASIN